MMLEIDDDKLEDLAVLIESCFETFIFGKDETSVKHLLEDMKQQLIAFLQVTYPERFK